ncbi:hypothetical protein NMG60_11015997 [Bertholletia excelsa]
MMDGGVFPPDLAMDLDYMDKLLLEGCWLETTDGSQFLQNSLSPSPSNAVFDTSFIWPCLEECNGESSTIPLQKDSQEERQRSSFTDNMSTSEAKGQSPNNSLSPAQQSEVDLAGNSYLSRRWWIGPKSNPGPGSSVMDRLIRALEHIKDSSRHKDLLIQLWIPVNNGGRRFLTTHDQPFSLDLNSPSLACYRDISSNYQFSTEENSKGIMGLPGRVFKGKVPEWTPDVRFFRNDEYARVDHAQQCGICGTLALPVFEQVSQNCLGVIEVVMTTQKVKYRPELESVCKALQAVDLRSSEISSTQNVKASNTIYHVALPEILEVLKTACETHRLPLAQTWVACVQQGKGGTRHSNENYVHCVSTVDSACYIADPRMQSFHEACSEHHLLKGQGIVGQAFKTNQPCFSSDVTSFTKTEYPLSHHARMFRLCAAVAIRLRCIYTGRADFVLEFFLPINCVHLEEQKKMLASLSTIIQKVCRSLRVISDKELAEENISPVDGSERYSREAPSSATNCSALISGRGEPMEVLTEKSSVLNQAHRDLSSRASGAFGGDYSNSGEGSFLNVVKKGDRRRTKVEKAITLQILQQYFAGSLKDAAKGLGVCPTTLKRICRQHGITRWPSRKIKKVGHSLQKLQLVIDSVQGASGSFQIKSYYSDFPELVSSDVSRTSPFSNSKQSKKSKSLDMQPQGNASIHISSASKSRTSSCSQSSSSSQCCSSGTQPQPTALNDVSGGEIENSVLKRVRSEAELRDSSEEVRKLLPRSQSHKSFSQQPKPEKIPPAPRSDGGKSQEGVSPRVKVTFGEEKIRFRMQNKWGYKNLVQEIARRFGIFYDTGGFQLKYFDDDSDWILLTCDSDLEECIDLCKLSPNPTIKLSLSRTAQQYSGSSFGSSSPPS